MKRNLLLSLLLLLFPLLSMAQKDIYYRVRAEFSVKEKSSDGRSSLTMGRVYYDKARKRIVYDVLFPEKEKWLFTDSVMYTIRDGITKKQPIVGGYIDFSIFNLSLNNNLKDYGLQNSIYELNKVVKDEDMVISIWTPKKEYANIIGDVKVSIRGNQLYGVLVYDAAKKLIGKQVFSDYIRIGGFEFPGEIINFTYLENGEEIKQITNYKNVKINNWDEDIFYNYNVSTP
ncbi:MAG: hypothetical protein RBS07_11920 [Lentimicrobium sp.]|nr:hypothetical protein [Lentimicrobium sp.]